MMTRLMTWFIELRNRFNESRLSKISTIYVLNWVDDLTSWQQNWLQSRNNIAANSKFKLTRSNFNHESNNRSWLSSSLESSLSSSSSSFSSSSFSFSFSKKSHNKQFVKKMLWKQSIVKLKTDDRKMKLIRVSFESY